MKSKLATSDRAAHGFGLLAAAQGGRGEFPAKGGFDWFQGEELADQLANGGKAIATLRIWMKP